MRILITGSAGFVAPYIADALRALAPHDCDVVQTVRKTGQTTIPGVYNLDIEDAEAVRSCVQTARPTHVVHLAAVSSPHAAGADPDLAWRVNVGGTLSIARAILEYQPDCTLLFAGSGQVYGETAKLNRAMTETDVIAPVSDYAVTKAAADLALGALATKGLRCVRFRPFNHTGVGQTEDFVLPSFAAQIARIEAGMSPPVIRVGNLDVERDFLDVRDVAEAYAHAVLRSDDIPPGTILNIASGRPQRIGALLDTLLACSTVPISVEQDKTRMRGNETPRFFGDAGRAKAVLEWAPRREFSTVLQQLLQAARSSLSGAIT